MRKYLLLLLVMTGSFVALSQHQEVLEKPALWKGEKDPAQDTTSLLHAFKKGKMQAHFRYFFMSTDNAAGLSDYYANAIGGGIKYETAHFKGFQFGVSGFFIFNLGSSDLSQTDAKTKQGSRYEIGLFDIENPTNRTDIDRLEELYLKYSWKQSHITFGKQLINTPFINLQDGRMRPTEVGGVYSEINDIRDTKIEGGYLFELSPRSTVRWFRIEESIGVYAVGVNPDGSKSAYANNLTSKGIGMLGVSRKFGNVSAKVYNVFVENIFNSILLQGDYSYPLKGNNKLVAAAQYIRQDAMKDGGNADPAKTYFTKGGKSQTFGAKLGWENKRWQTSVNYNRITADGRYLMPREWGREPFFTFLPRERNDGFGDVHAYTIKAGYSISKLRLKSQLGIGYYDLPDVANFALNKYGMPSYKQINVDIRYEFAGFLKGLESQFLYVYKARSGDHYENFKYVINKVDMSLWNVVFNYHF